MQPILMEDGADCGGICFGADKHLPSMAMGTSASKGDVPDN
jgi:hypothetical protein